MPARGAIVLGGGRSSRMGTDKLALVLDGRSLLERATGAAFAWADAVVVAGDRPQPWVGDPRVRFRPEEPRFGGPVAGIAAALDDLVDAEEILLLAGDLADPAGVVTLLADAEWGPAGVVLEDDEGWPQYLAGCYRAEALTAAVAALPHARDVSVRRLLRGLRLARRRVDGRTVLDLDTPEVAKLVGAEDPHLRMK